MNFRGHFVTINLIFLAFGCGYTDGMHRSKRGNHDEGLYYVLDTGSVANGQPIIPFISTTTESEILFQVQACEVAHIKLMRSKPFGSRLDYVDSYEVILDNGDNRQVVIKSEAEKYIVASPVPLLDCNEYQQFWLSWLSGNIAIGRGSELYQDTIAEWKYKQEKQVSVLSFSTNHNVGKWKINKDIGRKLEVDDVKYNGLLVMDVSKYDTNWLSFKVKAKMNVSIVLITENEKKYEITLGAFNQETYIRSDGEIKANANTPHILHHHQLLSFWLSWEAGNIKIGAGSVNGPFELVSWQDPEVDSLVEKISFSATEEYSNAWQFPNQRDMEGTMSVSRSTSTQPEAKTLCSKMGPSHRLADIESPEESDRMVHNLICYRHGSYLDESGWIGMEKEDGKWTWQQNSRPAFLSTTNWDVRNMAFGRTDQKCAIVMAYMGLAYIYACGFTRDFYFCEADVPNPCDPNPCFNGGTCCVVDFSAHCKCPEGRHGQFCTEMDECLDIHGYPQNERGPYGMGTPFNSSTLKFNTGTTDIISGIHYTLSHENSIQYISCIGFSFGDGETKYRTPCHGTADGQIQNITLGRQEFIIRITGEYTDQYITKLYFKTSNGKTLILGARSYFERRNQNRSFRASNEGAPLVFVSGEYRKHIYNLKFTFLFDSQYVHELAGKLYSALQNNISQLPAIYEKHKVMLPAIAKRGCSIHQNENVLPLCKLKLILNQLATLDVNLKSYTKFEPRQLTQYADYDTLKLLDNSETARRFHSILRDLKVDIHTSATTVNTSHNIGIYFKKVASFDKRTAVANRRYITDQLGMLKHESQNVTNSINSKLFDIIEIAIAGSEFDIFKTSLNLIFKIGVGIMQLCTQQPPDFIGIIQAAGQLFTAVNKRMSIGNLKTKMISYFKVLDELQRKIHTQANSRAMLMIKAVVDKFATVSMDEQDALAEEFVSKCSDFSPPISLSDITDAMQSLDSLADEVCAVAREYNPRAVPKLCQTIKDEIAKLKLLSEQFYNFLFNLIAALTKIVRNTIAVKSSGPLERAVNGIDLTMLTIGSLMLEMKYQTSAQARCMVLEYTHGGKRPQICEHLLFTPELISDISAFSGANTPTSDKTKYAYIPTTEPDNNDPWINLYAFINGQEQNLPFSSNISTEWLLRYGWISGGDLSSNPETAYYVKRFEAYVPGMRCIDRQPVQITIEATTSSNVNTRLFNYEAPPTYFIQSSNMRFTYREHTHRDACPNTVEEFAVKHDNESQTSLSPRQLCAISRGDLPRIDNKQDRIYPSLLSQWTLKLSKRSDCELVKDDSDYQPLITVKLEVRSVHHTHGINECWPATRCGPSERCVDGVLSYTCDRVFINGTYNQARRVN